jgi:hypothetical protein
MNLRFAFVLVALSGLISSALAHPGHDLMSHGAAHVATSPYHLAILCLAALTMGALGFLVHSLRAQRLLRFGAVGLGCLALVLALWH